MAADGARTLWTGWEPRSRAKNRDPVAFGPSSSDAERYELLALAGRGFRPPQFLAVDVLVDDADLREEPTLAARDALRWEFSLEYRQLAETAPRTTAPHAIYLLGVDPPEGATDDDLVAFNEFYTEVHLGEVAERRQALRAARYELSRAMRPPYVGSPRYLAVYEVDEEGAGNRRHSGPPYSRGPDVWQAHTTPWRLWYSWLSG